MCVCPGWRRLCPTVSGHRSTWEGTWSLTTNSWDCGSNCTAGRLDIQPHTLHHAPALTRGNTTLQHASSHTLKGDLIPWGSTLLRNGNKAVYEVSSPALCSSSVTHTWVEQSFIDGGWGGYTTPHISQSTDKTFSQTVCQCNSWTTECSYYAYVLHVSMETQHQT